MANLWGWGLLGLVGYDMYNRYNTAKKESQILLENQKKKERVMKLFDEYNLKLERWRNNSFIDVYDELEFYFYILEFAESNLKQSETKTVSLESRLSLFNENADNYLFSQQEKTKWEEIRDEIKFRIDKIISTYGEKLIEKQKIEKILFSIILVVNDLIKLRSKKLTIDLITNTKRIEDITNVTNNLKIKSDYFLQKDNRNNIYRLIESENKHCNKSAKLWALQLGFGFLLVFFFALFLLIGMAICGAHPLDDPTYKDGVNLQISAWFFLSLWMAMTLFVTISLLIIKNKRKKNLVFINKYIDDFMLLHSNIVKSKDSISYFNPDLNFIQENQDICYLDLNQKENKFEGNGIIIDSLHVKLDWNNSKYSISNRNVSYVVDKFSKYYEQYESDINEKKKRE